MKDSETITLDILVMMPLSDLFFVYDIYSAVSFQTRDRYST